MSRIAIILFLVSPTVFGQLTIDAAKDSLVTKYHIGASTYLDQFVGHPGYGAIVILTNDGGAAAFGDGDEGLMLIWLGAFYVHITLGGISLLTGWSQFLRSFRKKNLSFHRTLGKIYLIAVMISELCGLY